MIANAPAFPPVSTPASPQTRGHVLIVDDEDRNRMLLRDPLEARGFQVTEAESGPKALEAVSLAAPDTILLDVMMPGMDGFQVCRTLKSQTKTAHVPILMVTALSERKERLLGIEAGANDFLNKPVDIQDLILRVGNAVTINRLFGQLQAERERADRLLFNTLPASIAERMKRGELNIADQHQEVTVLVSDLVGFTTLAALVEPDEIVSLLNEIFSEFDTLTERRGLEKIKTMGDAYMVAGGLPEQTPDCCKAVADLALDMQKAMAQFNRQYATSIQLRIGISTGPVVAGVIGRKKFAFDIWGDTVNLACRLEASAGSGVVQVCPNTFEKLKHEFHFEGNQLTEIKGRGTILVHHLSE